MTYKKGKYYYYNFVLNGTRYTKSTKKTDKREADKVEQDLRDRLQGNYEAVVKHEQPQQGRQTLVAREKEFMKQYRAHRESWTFAEYCLKPIVRLHGENFLYEITTNVVLNYQTTRVNEGAANKTVNEEVRFFVYILPPAQGILIREELKRLKRWKLPVEDYVGKAYTPEEIHRMLEEARRCRTPVIHPALLLALRCGLRDKEIRTLVWARLDLLKRKITVGKSKSEESTGRAIWIIDEVLMALQVYRDWYIKRFGQIKP